MTFVFVGGSQRSGTSLLAASLCAGEETNMYMGESSGFRTLIQTYASMVQRFDDETVFHFGSRNALDEYYSATVRLFLSHTLTAHAPATSLVMKEPHLTMHFPYLNHLVPNSRFVMIKRDPRDIVVSMLKVGEKLAAKGQKHPYNTQGVGRLAEIAAQFYRPVLASSATNPGFRKKLFWVDYQELVTSTETVMDKLRDFTGLKLELFDPADPTKRTLPQKVDSRKKSDRAQPWNTELMKNKGVSNASVRAFEKKLSDEQVAEIEKSVGGLIKKFGYNLVSQ